MTNPGKKRIGATSVPSVTNNQNQAPDTENDVQNRNGSDNQNQAPDTENDVQNRNNTQSHHDQRGEATNSTLIRDGTVQFTNDELLSTEPAPSLSQCEDRNRNIELLVNTVVMYKEPTLVSIRETSYGVRILLLCS